MGSPLQTAISSANALFESQRFAECLEALDAAFPLIEDEENWLLGAAVLVQYGRCCEAIAKYERANIAYRQAMAMLERLHQPGAERLDVVQKLIGRASSNEVSFDEGQRVNQRAELLCNQPDFDGADALLEAELSRAVRQVGAENWFVGRLKVILGHCKLARLNAILAEDAEPDQISGDVQQLFEEIRELCAEVQQLTTKDTEAPHWLVLQVQDVHKALEAFVANFEKAQSGCDGEQPERPASTALTTWVEPFIGVRFSVRPEDALLLEPPHQLFLRREHEQCLGQLQALLETAQVRGDALLAGLVLTMAARCHRAVGGYDAALESLESALDAFSHAGDQGERLCDSLDSLLSDCTVEDELQTSAAAVNLECHQLLTAGHPAEAAELCATRLQERRQIPDGLPWYEACLLSLQVDYLVQRMKAVVAKSQLAAAVSTDAAAIKDDLEFLARGARALLQEAEQCFDENLHVYWVRKNFIADSAAKLDEFCSQQQLVS